jgi:predicted methyltransferase
MREFKLKYDELNYHDIFRTIIYVDGVKHEIFPNPPELEKCAIYIIKQDFLYKAMGFMERFAKSVKIEDNTMSVTDVSMATELNEEPFGFTGTIYFQSMVKGDQPALTATETFQATFAFGKMLEIKNNS